MEFRQLEAFVNAVKYKSFSKAADATFLTQPTISAHINNLENEMGTTLVNRTETIKQAVAGGHSLFDGLGA